jgi:hypothetical protein
VEEGVTYSVSTWPSNCDYTHCIVHGDDEEALQRLEAIATEATAAGWLEPLGHDRKDRRLWRACDLASMVEGCFHEMVDPTTIDEEAERPWIERLRGSFVLPEIDAQRDSALDHERRYWLLDGGRRAGTVKLSHSAFRGPWLFVHSLYALRAYRGRGLASTALARLADAAVRQELAGVRLSTCWTWQRSVRFYLDHGFWIYMWKHDLQLVCEPKLPERRFACDESTASLDIVVGGEPQRLWTAHREGDQLLLEDANPKRDRHDELDRLSLSTFAMLLALSGWPLVRSERHWAKRYGWSDVGEPEGLAYKIGVFEEVAREHGWVVATPTIPGLAHWQAWAKGQLYGREEQLMRDLDAITRERGWRLDETQHSELRRLDAYFAEQLLRHAVAAPSFEQWWQTADNLLGARRGRSGSQ